MPYVPILKGYFKIGVWGPTGRVGRHYQIGNRFAILSFPRRYMTLLRSACLAACLVIGFSHSACTREQAPSTSANRLIATFRREPKSFNRFVSANAPENLLTLLTQATLVRVNRVTGE